MPYHATFPTLYDDCKSIDISSLRRWDYLKPNQWRSGTITWSRNGEKTGMLSVTVDTNTDQPYLELDYQCDKVPIKYRVNLVTVPSNLGKGVVWYFVCPRTGKRCRKLYLVDTYFFHRLAFRGCMYEKQTYSKHSRETGKQFEQIFVPDSAYEQLYSKYFKRTYAGRPTKKYLKLLRKVNTVEVLFQRLA